MPSHGTSHVIFTMQKHNRVKRQKPSDSLFFQMPLFLDVWPQPLRLCFLRSSLEPKPVPSAFPRATWTSLHVLRKHKTQAPHLREEKEPSGNNARYHRTAAPLPQREVSAVGMGAQLSPSTSGTAAPLRPLADRVPSASKGSTALDVRPTAGRKGWPTVPFTPFA